MGTRAQFESCPVDAWPLILSRLADAGVCIDGQGEERGMPWCDCRLGRASIGVSLEPDKDVDNVTLYCSAFRYWRGFPMTAHLYGIVTAVVRLTAREAAS